MRILTVATTYPRWEGDSEPSFVHDLNRHLVARGHEVTAVVPHAANARVSEQVDGVRIERFRYAPEPFETLFYDGGAMPKLRNSWRARLALPGAVVAIWRALRREMQHVRPDLVHVHWLVPQGALAVRPARAAGIPLVISAHGADIHQLARTPARRWIAQAIESADAITANTRDTAACVEEVAKPRRLAVIPMGLDLDLFSPRLREPRVRRGDPWILAVGRLVEKKGFIHLVEAVPALLRDHPQLRVTICGTGPERDRLDSRIAELDVGHAVELVGPVDRQTVASYMASADLFVGPSIVDAKGDTEAQGVVFIEAMAAGCPIVATRVGGIPDVIEDGVHGRLVEPGRTDLLAVAIAEALANPSLRDAWTRTALERVKRYSWKTIAAEFEQLYEATV
jgi:glycosyltransferase involved in cell wall biosynthesis